MSIVRSALNVAVWSISGRGLKPATEFPAHPCRQPMQMK
jgi:hypothetical protein